MYALAELLRTTCATWEDSPCFRDLDRSLTFAEVGQVTDRLAQVLAAQVPDPEAPRPRTGFAPVPVVAGGGVDLYLLFFAAIKSGRAFLPMSPALSATNIKGILDAMDLPHEVWVGPGLKIDGVKTREMSQLFDRAAQVTDFGVLTPIKDTDAVTYQTTSGTTGTPKVIPISGENCLFQNDLSHKVACHRAGQTHGICGDWVPRQFLSAFTVGSCNSFLNVPQASRAEINSWMRGHEIGYLTIYLNALKIFFQLGEVFEDLEWVLTGGEALSLDYVQGFEQITRPGASLINCYGAQETGTMCVFTHHHGGKIYEGAWPVGKSVLPGRMAVVDEAGRSVPSGTQGDIVVRFGTNLVVETGYLGSTRNVPLHADGSYITGDRGYEDADGNFFVTGRSDDMVKINSYFVPVGEIESAMRKVPGVSDAAVKGVELSPTTRVLAAYFEGEATPDQIKSALATKLPAFMRPHFVLPVDKFPRGPTGKLMKRALTFELPKGPQARTAETSSPLGKDLRDLWSALLTHSEFDDQSNFFDVGGDSLSSVQLALEIERRYDQRIGVAEFLNAGASIAGLFALLTNAGVDPSRSVTLEASPVDGAAILARNAEIMAEWAPAEKRSSSGQFIYEEGGKRGTALVWILQGRVEYEALKDALPDVDFFATRSFANLAGQLDPSGQLTDEDLYQPELIEPVAKKLVAEILAFAQGRRIVLGGNCQATLMVEAMIRSDPSVLDLVDAGVFLNPIKPFRMGNARISLLFGAEELRAFEVAHGDPQIGFSAQAIEVLGGTHGTYFSGESFPRIADTLRRQVKPPLGQRFSRLARPGSAVLFFRRFLNLFLRGL